MKLNQFALYRVDQNTDGKVLWHLPYQEASRQNVPIRVEYYRKMAVMVNSFSSKFTFLISSNPPFSFSVLAFSPLYSVPFHRYLSSWLAVGLRENFWILSNTLKKVRLCKTH